jgi:hypothetical protein
MSENAEHDVDRLIDALIDREGGYVNHRADRGGATCFGITEAVARAHGYAGAMKQLPRDEAAAIYRRLYWLRPRFNEVAGALGRLDAAAHPARRADRRTRSSAAALAAAAAATAALRKPLSGHENGRAGCGGRENLFTHVRITSCKHGIILAS